MTRSSEDEGQKRLVDLYNQYFEIVPADTDELRNVVFGIRFQVLAVEHNYFNPDVFPDGMERDEFDEHSAHFLLRHRPSDSWAGTVRIVLPVGEVGGIQLPIQEECNEPLVRDSEVFPSHRMGEVSRLSISKDFRRRINDTVVPDGLEATSSQQIDGVDKRRLVPHMVLGLMQAVVRACAENELTYVAAIMERQLLRLLSRFGIYLTEVGSLIELFGWRQPCYRDLTDLLNDVKSERQDVWEILTIDGALHDDLLQLRNRPEH